MIKWTKSKTMPIDEDSSLNSELVETNKILKHQLKTIFLQNPSRSLLIFVSDGADT